MENQIEKSGFLLINKPADWTSFDVVAKLRGVTGVKKIGHAGTLDPFATGLLVIAVGRGATKQISEFVKKDKVYETTLCLGAKSTTHDPEGEIEELGIKKEVIPDQKKVDEVVVKFLGKQEQTPPMFSAKKVGGKKLYQLARQGKEIERWPEEIEIFDLRILDYSWPKLRLRVHCSSGTYIRVLGADIGSALLTEAYLLELKRIAIGDFSLSKANQLEEIDSENWSTFLF